MGAVALQSAEAWMEARGLADGWIARVSLLRARDEWCATKPRAGRMYGPTLPVPCPPRSPCWARWYPGTQPTLSLSGRLRPSSSGTSDLADQTASLFPFPPVLSLWLAVALPRTVQGGDLAGPPTPAPQATRVGLLRAPCAAMIGCFLAATLDILEGGDLGQRQGRNFSDESRPLIGRSPARQNRV
ncbi:hypothetical protein JX265_002989 [Neoarthrinium moseri]|uniref:Uncharacterized protein n=1 Tax=Neoarthrinium moseri TaxID=1658444 RepID=A0A9P9WTF1_9PEZI|nr:uncharacterized protein JN550_006081 [Neoarthrinium moseri]KAI1869094.1 hypothetical protein JN550_006081 [Neoarthrinium moseri]KAI1878812.1 hypothetical protein JX265_002989 [Neoarthrinium moseri]